jgi:hypothetical protein
VRGTVSLRLAILAATLVNGAAAAQSFIDIDAGVVYSDVSASEVSPVDGDFSSGDAGFHFGIGAYRNKEDSPWVYGVKLEVQDVVGNTLFSLRAIDVGYRFSPQFTLNGFLGAARYDLTTAATGYRVGFGGQYWYSDRWALTTELAFGDALARDKLLPEEDPDVGSPDIFYDVLQLSLYLKYKF